MFVFLKRSWQCNCPAKQTRAAAQLHILECAIRIGSSVVLRIRTYGRTEVTSVDRKWGFWDIDLGNFRKLGQFSFLNLNFAEKSKNKRKKYKN